MSIFKKVAFRKPLPKIHFIKMRTEGRAFDHIQSVNVGVYNTSIVNGGFDLDILINSIAKNPGTGNQFYQFVNLDHSHKIPVSVNGEYFGLATNISKINCNIAGACSIEYYVISIVYDDVVQSISDSTFVKRFTERVNTGRFGLYVDRFEDKLYLDFRLEGFEDGATPDDKTPVPDN